MKVVFWMLRVVLPVCLMAPKEDCNGNSTTSDSL